MTSFAPEGFEPVADMNHQRPDDTPGWTESYAFWAYWEGRYFYIHFGRHPDDSSMWRGYVALNGEDGSVLASHAFGREYSPFGPGFQQIHAICERPWESYRVEVDTVAQVNDRTTLSSQVLPSLGNDIVPLKMELQFASISATYDPMRDLRGQAQSNGKWTHYTPCRVHGYVTIEGERQYIDTLGFRDHSAGVRSIDKMGSGFMQTGMFESGRSYMAIGVRSMNDDGEEVFFTMGGITVDGQVHYAKSIEFDPRLISFPEPGVELGDIRFETDLGTSVISLATTGQGVPLTNQPPCYENIGQARDPGDLVYWDWRVETEWDGEKGIGGWESCIRMD